MAGKRRNVALVADDGLTIIKRPGGDAPRECALAAGAPSEARTACSRRAAFGASRTNRDDAEAKAATASPT
jgi:hypothetical protein